MFLQPEQLCAEMHRGINKERHRDELRELGFIDGADVFLDYLPEM